ncbi:MAG: hypothetical protein D6732_20220 [Methanobacteriota archaeon]|nr:MAG: hypothetical protein D6732_20220 [Euryarchaeota archaeon]
MSYEFGRSIVAVLSHPDDELGMVGTLAKHAELGDSVFMVYLSYGELTTKFGNLPIPEIKTRRKEQAEEISSILGVSDPIFLDLGDTNILPTKENAIKLAEILIDTKPKAIVTWGINAHHPDHRNTGKLVLDAMTFCRLPKLMPSKRSFREPIRLFHYVDQDSIDPVIYVDVTQTIQKAIACGEYYEHRFGWAEVGKRMEIRRRSRGMESNCQYAEKFNEKILTHVAKDLLI